MDHTRTMCVTESVGHLADITGNQVQVKMHAVTICLIYAFAQCAATNKRHNQISQPLVINERLIILIDGQNIFMFQLCYGIGLALKACQENTLLIGVKADRRDKYLYCNGTNGARLLSQVDCSHTPTPNDALQGTGP